jgi:hypothetical protein
MKQGRERERERERERINSSKEKIHLLRRKQLTIRLRAKS